MQCQILFSGKNKKNISKCRLLIILPRVLSVKQGVKYCTKTLSDAQSDFTSSTDCNKQKNL